MDLVSPDQESDLADLISLWQRRRAQGESVTAAELCQERPELLPALKLVRTLAEVLSLAQPFRAGDQRAGGKCLGL